MFWGFYSSLGAFCFAVLVVLPLVLCFFSSWCCGWQWSFDAGHIWSLLLAFVFWCPGVLGCFSFFWWLSVGAWGLLPAWGVRLLPSRGCVGVCLVAFVFLCSGASAFSCPLALCSFCSWFVWRFALQVFFFFLFFFFFFFSLPFSFSSSSWLSSSLAVCSLWSPSCFPCLALPGVWPSLVLGLVGPSWPLFVVVLVLSSIVWSWWWWWPCWRWWWWSAFARLWCMASVCSLAWWWLAFVRLWFWCGWLVVAFARLWCEASICSSTWWMVGVCSPLVLVWLVSGGRFSRLWCEASVCSLAWWWLAFVRLWLWRGWLVVAFARLWWPRVCSLGRWLASVCLGSVVAAGFVVACHGYAAWVAVPGSCWCWRPSSF